MNAVPSLRLALRNGHPIKLSPAYTQPLSISSCLATTSHQQRHYTPPVIAGITEADVSASTAHCTNLVRNFDSPSHTLQTFIPPSARLASLALRALNIDLARVADVTSTPTVGALRMQFWRDAITSALAFTPRKEPAIILLSAAAAQLAVDSDGTRHLSKAWLLRLVSAREQYLHNAPYPTLDALEAYAERTYSTLLYLTLSACGVQSVAADHLASHIGKAQGIAAVLRGLPLVAFPPPPNHHSNRTGLDGSSAQAPQQQQQQQGAVMLPLDIMASSGVRETDVLRSGSAATGLRDAVFAVATRANDHLITAREMLRSLKQGEGAGHEFEHAGEVEHQYDAPRTNGSGDIERCFGVFLPAVSTQLWLDKLQKCDFDVFHPSLRRSDWRLPWKAYWAYRRQHL